MDNTFYSFYDEEGNEVLFELIASFKVNDTEYAMLRPEDATEDEVLICRVTSENGEDVLELVEDDEEIMVAIESYEELSNQEGAKKMRS